MALRVGHTLEWVASEIGVSTATIRYWMQKGLLRGGPAKGSRDGYSYAFVDQAMIVHEWLQLYPRGPLDNLVDLIDSLGLDGVRKHLRTSYPEAEEDDDAA